MPILKIFSVSAAMVGLSLGSLNASASLPACNDAVMHDITASAIRDTYAHYGVPENHESTQLLLQHVPELAPLPADLKLATEQQALMHLSQSAPGLTAGDIASCRAEYLPGSFMLALALLNPQDRSEVGAIVLNVGIPNGSAAVYGWPARLP